MAHSSTPLISIITPLWNAAPFIEETMNSVLRQTYTNWEWFIVDDGSTDNSAEIVKRCGDERVHLISAKHSGLPAVGRNIGIAHAKGDLVAFLDADDIWLPEKLATQVDILAKNNDVGLVFSPYAMWAGEGMAPSHVVPDTSSFPNPGGFFPILCLRNQLGNSTVLLRHSLLAEHGMLDEDPEIRGCEDYELWLRLSFFTKFAFSAKPLVWYRVHPGSVSHNETRNCRASMRVIERITQRFSGAPELPARSRLEANWQFRLGRAQLLDGADDKGRSALLRSLRGYPLNLKAWIYLFLSVVAPGYARNLGRLNH